ncbi:MULTISPECIES: hypothetical protein [Sorangium]|uniref:hypothetical protein n=1 Tax=Sorangium TaxID=39643 RepID=UPI0013EAFB65|nr:MULTISPECIES: hypothetical protein [Sorangium]
MNFTGIQRALHRHRVRISPVNFTEFPRVATIIYIYPWKSWQAAAGWSTEASAPALVHHAAGASAARWRPAQPDAGMEQGASCIAPEDLAGARRRWRTTTALHSRLRREILIESSDKSAA